MPEQSSIKLGEQVEMTSAIPIASVIAHGVGCVYVGVPFEGTREVETRHPQPPQVTQTAGVESANRCGRRWFALFVGVPVILAAMTQAILAGIIYAQGIKIMDRFWEGTDNMYPTAGNPWIGILTLITTVVVIYKVGFDNNDRCCSVGYELSLLSLLVILVFVFGWSFCERAVYTRLHQFDDCINKTEDINGSDWTGDCYCWSYGDDSVTANVNIADHMSCDRVLDYVDSVLVSYILMMILMGLMFWATVIDLSLFSGSFSLCDWISEHRHGTRIPRAAHAGEVSPWTYN